MPARCRASKRCAAPLMLTQERPIFDKAISRGEFASDADWTV
jgi:hypothetical protein